MAIILSAGSCDTSDGPVGAAGDVRTTSYVSLATLLPTGRKFALIETAAGTYIDCDVLAFQQALLAKAFSQAVGEGMRR